jgi:hypothetical protein
MVNATITADTQPLIRWPGASNWLLMMAIISTKYTLSASWEKTWPLHSTRKLRFRSTGKKPEGAVTFPESVGESGVCRGESVGTGSADSLGSGGALASESRNISRGQRQQGNRRPAGWRSGWGDRNGIGHSPAAGAQSGTRYLERRPRYCSGVGQNGRLTAPAGPTVAVGPIPLR